MPVAGEASRGRQHPQRSRLAFALDYPTLREASAGAEAVADCAGVLKVGLELFVREGAAALELGRRFDSAIFLDLKLHDIPETVERAVAVAAGFGVKYLTLHAGGGRAMLEAAQKRAEREASGLTLLAVTVLTSLDQADLASVGVNADPTTQALRLAELAKNAGIGGLVCSAAEVGRLRQAVGPELVLVTPGIRPGSGHSDDQKRVGTPRSAILDGASLLVVGRPIRDAQNPGNAALSIVEEIAEALHDETQSG